MMKYMLTATALVLILMVMWLPARTPPEIFEETALREALMLRTGEGIPMPETAANLAVEYLDGARSGSSGRPRPLHASTLRRLTDDEGRVCRDRQGRRAYDPDRVAACHEEPLRDGDPAPCRHDRGHHRTHALHSRADCRRIRETPHPRSRSTTRRVPPGGPPPSPCSSLRSASGSWPSCIPTIRLSGFPSFPLRSPWPLA